MTLTTFEQILLPISRWLHLMATTLLVGGTLFFEFVVPRGLVDFRQEQQLSIIAYLRLVFRRIVWGCVIVLPITGGVSLWNLWHEYVSGDRLSTAFLWTVAHTVLGMAGLAIAAALVLGRSVPDKSRQWMKFNFVLLMMVVLIASCARQMRLFTRQRILQQHSTLGSPTPPFTMP